MAPFVIVFPDFQCVPGIPHTRFKLYRQQAGRNAVPFCRSEKIIHAYLPISFFWRALWNTIRIWGVNIVLQLGLAFLLTVVFSDIKYKFKGLPVFRALYYLPNLIAATSVAFLFKTLLDWRYGTFNQILNSVYQFFGVNKAPVDWLEIPAPQEASSQSSVHGCGLATPSLC